MVFSSPIFLFLLLPVVLTAYLVCPGLRAKNYWLLLASLLFYAWGEPVFIFLLLASTVANYFLGRWVDGSQTDNQRKTAVTVAVVVNVGLLAFFKYANAAVALLNWVLALGGISALHVPHIPLPIGISFFTFHALSYVVDIYRRKWKAAGSPADVALYIFFFPQLIAGPILRWNAIGPQLAQRAGSLEQFAEGVRRFAGGLAKKVLIANIVAQPADQIFALPANELSLATAWFGLLCYTLQIYFDFSGYSDMAIGMGKMFGFTFMENFNFPYISQSIREFWRRWHISLSSWFRDYLYIPLGGNRGSDTRTGLNLLTVFLLCGLWHGASLTFVVWGLYHGFFLVLERTRFGTVMERLPRTLRHLYVFFVVMMGWVIFRAETFPVMCRFFAALFGGGQADATVSWLQYVKVQTLVAIGFGIVFSGPAWQWLKDTTAKLDHFAPNASRPVLAACGTVLEIFLVLAALVTSSAWLAGGTYNPFIYFRF